MRRLTLRILFVCALVAWGAAVWQLWSAWNTKAAPRATTHGHGMVLAVVDTCRRDPFRRVHQVEPQSAHAVRTHNEPQVAHPKDSIPAPPLPRWNAFVEGNPPFVILAKSGKSELVKVGDSVFGWRVLSLSPNGAKLRCANHLADVSP